MDFEDLQILPTPKGYATQQQIAQQRKLAQLLMDPGRDKTPMTHPAQVFGNLGKDLFGASQFNQANELERSSALQDAGKFTEGAQGAMPQSPPAFDSPVKGAAAHFALLAQKYSGVPLEQTVNEWRKGQGGGEFVSGQTGLSPDTPITPELLRSPQGIALVKAMADLDAGGKAPLTDEQWAEAHQMAFGGEPAEPATAGGEGNAASAIAAALKGGGAEGADPAMAYASAGDTAAVAPKFGSPPVPGGPVTRVAPDAAGGGNIIPSGNVPHRIGMSKEALINTLASTYLDPSVKQAALQLYLEQTQPLQMKIPGGTMSIDPNTGRQVPIPELFRDHLKAGDSSVPVGMTYDWTPGKGVTQNYVPMGGAASGGGPLGTAPPAASAPGSVIPPQLNEVANFSNNQKRIQEYNDQDLKALHTKLKETTDIGIQAARNTPLLKQLRQIIEDPKLKQSIGSDLFLDWDRVKALFGSKEGERGAALMQAFDKMVSGQIVSDLKTQLQGTGQIRVAEINLVEKASASRYNTREANRAVLNLMIKSNEQMEGLAKATAEYLAEHKDKATTAGLLKHKLEWLEKNPMLTPQEIKDYNTKFDEDPKYPVPPAGAPGTKTNFRNPQPALATPPPAATPTLQEIEKALRDKGLLK